MAVALTMLGDENIERILSDPPLVWRVIAPEDAEAYEQARREQSRPSLLGSLFGSKKVASATPATALVLREPEGSSTDVDKAWHGIHYLLTGTAAETSFPLSFLLSGGRSVGSVDVGYGPARVFTAAETKTIYDAIKGLSDDELRGRFNPGDMTAQDVYPKIWSRGSEDETIGYLLEQFAGMRRFLQQATDFAMGIVIALC
jgi:hypothetical protein